ncbi:AraC family transcriptional regulator [Arenibacter sp. BSSL-BM3]|uniref:AraC family transcriptional regulator n=1 Tax=Arenibacter arenosicollis TaxID=2762274 RepID=A0ABR7QQT0_9FLAO|nr:helix-turn-helix domain-containing protein [Arenibacter arenosicollis]MBC8769305.1 AraC family transcriptional regulator [Arenibacter arenosicollis]
MRFCKYFPNERLRPYIKYFAVSENEMETEYKVFPTSGLVMGFQYIGQLAILTGNIENKLGSSGITGISDRYKIFINSAGTGTILVYFTEIGFNHFTSLPATELYNLSLSLDDIFNKNNISEVEEKLTLTTTDKERNNIVEQFLLSQLKDIETDKLITEAVKLIYQSNGTVRIKELNQKLFISQSPFEKRFRKVVGSSPKRFASIVRFNAVLDSLNTGDSLTKICYDNNFFDQAHFIKNFKQFTGDTPENFKRFL